MNRPCIVSPSKGDPFPARVVDARRGAGVLEVKIEYQSVLGPSWTWLPETRISYSDATIDSRDAT